MSIALSQVLQRPSARYPVSGENICLQERLHAVMRVIFDVVLEDVPEQAYAHLLEASDGPRVCQPYFYGVSAQWREAR